MNISEFRDFLLHEGYVECRLPKQRNQLAEFIQDGLGFQIGSGTLDYMTRHPDGLEYMLVGLYNITQDPIVVFFARAKKEKISFDEISSLILLVDSSLDDRTDTEFAKDFALLIDPQGSKHNSIIEAEFTSIWDGGFAVTTGCKVNMATKEVFDIEVSTEVADMVNNLDEEYITIDGENYPVVSDEYMENGPEEQGSYWYKK